MHLTCVRCGKDFEAGRFRGYCDDCVCFFGSVRDQVHKAQNPRPGVHACGAFTKVVPESVGDPVTAQQVCGLCGGKTECGHGFASGAGLGVYTFCTECYATMDFREDTGE